MALIKTELGQRLFKERSALLSVRQRSAFIMFDGIKSVEQVLVAAAGLGVVRSDIDHMVSNGLLADSGGVRVVASPTLMEVPTSPSPLADKIDSSPPQPPIAPRRSDQERYALAWPMATQLTAAMGIRGFRLNLAVEAASGYQDLLALLPKIQAAVGTEKAAAFERALKN